MEMSDNMSKKGFTLLELLVVAAVLGIIAAIVLPMYHGHAQRSKDAVAKDALHVMRSQIELYRFEHGGLEPGYKISPTGLKTPATLTELTNQFIGTSDKNGVPGPSVIPTGAYIYGPYMKKLPVNPFNKLSSIKYVASTTPFSTVTDKSTGWLYKRETAEFKLNWTGTDSEGKNYLDY